jgi:C-terminal processing protease CtpA/Prc/sugar lactone lactonase YvrE
MLSAFLYVELEEIMSRIFAIAVSAATVLIFFSINTSAHPPWGIVVDNQGLVYVSDLETVWKIDAQGRQSVFRKGVSGKHTHELTIDEAGNLFGEDLSYEPSTQRYTTAIWKMTPAGVFSYVLAPTVNPPKGMSIWKDRNGNTYLTQWNNNSDQQIFLLKRTPNGDVTTLIGSRKNGDEFQQVLLYDIGGMAFGTDGSLYLTDRANIQKVTMAGEVTTMARNIAAESSSNQNGQSSKTSLMGLTVDASGNVYAADFGNRRVLKITPNGSITTLLRAEESWSPTGVAFRNGQLYILESGNAANSPRVRKLSSDGKVSVLATVGNIANPPARQTPVVQNIEPITIPKVFAPQALIAMCVGVFALGLVIWRIRKKKVVKLFERKKHICGNSDFVITSFDKLKRAWQRFSPASTPSKNRLFVFVIILFVIVLIHNKANGQPSQDMTIDAATRTRVIEELLKNLNKSYVYLETAKKMETDIRNRMKNKEYDNMRSAKVFAKKLTDDLQAVSHDKHLRVSFSSEPIPVRKQDGKPTEEEKAANRFFQNRFNSGFEKVERLDGNIGYIDLRHFYDPESGAETVASAMSFVANTDALIIDLRNNGGGNLEMIPLIISYLFGDKPVHLNDLYYREINKTIEYRTKPNVPGKKYGFDKPVYILTSGYTFSGAEAFAYDLKNLKRAIIIGETTRGGANPGETVRLTENFAVFVSTGRAVNPITKTNWEGTGVTPDVAVPKEQALKNAYIMALNKSLEKIPYEYIKAGMKEIINQTQKELDEIKKEPKKIK